MDDIRVVELFAGVGGFRLGLEAASPRFGVVWANQWEPYKREQFAFDCYTKHFGKNDAHVCEDIALVKSQIPDHDFLVGGFPCQDYSIMKKNAPGINGKKGMLWWQIDDIVDSKRPKFILLENVDMIIRSPLKQPGRDFSIILRCLYEKGYAVEWRVINAAEYGFAQRRRRTFVLAYHNSTALYQELATRVSIMGIKEMHQQVMTEGIMSKSFPVASHEKEYVDTWVDDIAYADIDGVSKKALTHYLNSGIMMNGRIYSVNAIPKYEAPIPIIDVLEKDPVGEEYFIKDTDIPEWIYSKGPKHELRKRKDGTQYWFNEGAVAFPEPLDKPSRTMLTSESEVGRTSHVVTDQLTGRLRVLTPRECERLNGFPDDWTDTGMPLKMRYFCMGNALVTGVVTRIGNVLVGCVS